MRQRAKRNGLLSDARPRAGYTKVSILCASGETYATVLEDAKKPVSALRELAATILQQSKAPETMQVVGRLYALAYRRGDADAGYSWATMVLEGLLASSSPNKAQAAVDVYVNLARNGHAQSQFGLGRVLLSQAARSPENRTALVQRCSELWDSAGRNGMADAYYELGTDSHADAAGLTQ